MDPLSALRDFTIRNDLDKIVRVTDDYRFSDDYTFPATIETAYKSKHGQGNRYTLETLVFFIKNHHLKHTEYLQYAHSHRIPSVTLPDRKPLVDYLTGKTVSSDSIAFEFQSNHPHINISNTNNRNFGEEGSAAAAGLVSLENDTNGPKEMKKDLETQDPMELLKAVERPLRDIDEILECKGKDFYSILLAANKREEERQKMEMQQRKDGLVAKSRIIGGGEEIGSGGYEGAKRAKLGLKGSKIGEGVPIILVPSASQTLITIYNVKEFLEDGVFVMTDVKVKQMNGVRPECVTVQKKFSRDRVVTAYEVRDKPSALKAEDWDRVVAVFVLGKEWQFKDWPFKDHVEIFNKILGFYMRFEDDSVESARNVKQWNVKIISISKNKRHQDRAAALEVWDRLEDFMRSRAHS